MEDQDPLSKRKLVWHPVEGRNISTPADPEMSATQEAVGHFLLPAPFKREKFKNKIYEVKMFCPKYKITIASSHRLQLQDSVCRSVASNNTLGQRVSTDSTDISRSWSLLKQRLRALALLHWTPFSNIAVGKTHTYTSATWQPGGDRSGVFRETTRKIIATPKDHVDPVLRRAEEHQTPSSQNA
ncbi:hypothetical protein RRG08_044759 [Elysia crispata]|uniref:Uncharacterized protein n=1 Tax=Elysia crispata TaxID=231223 RepID=A0AAE0ZHM4_9GAST|nr:hypothetical protein RRG08_044759 [Elysia crispata]